MSFSKRLLVRVVGANRQERAKHVPGTAKEISLGEGDTRIIQPERIFLNAKGKPTIEFGPVNAQAWDPFSKEGLALSPMEYNGARKDNILQQIIMGIRQGNLAKAMNWIIIGVLVLSLIIQGSLSYQLGEKVDALSQQLYNAHPPPPPPTPSPTG